MSEAQKLIAEVVERHELRYDDWAVADSDFYACRCGEETPQGTGVNAIWWHAHLAAEIDKALGGLAKAWAAVLSDGSFFGPHHEPLSPDARNRAEADVAEHEGATLSHRWVSGWTPEGRP